MRRSRRLGALVAAVLVAAACSPATGPTPAAATPADRAPATQAPTPAPSAVPSASATIPRQVIAGSLPPLGLSAFDAGWRAIALLDNTVGMETVAVLDASGPSYGIAAVCAGQGVLVISLHDGRMARAAGAAASDLPELGTMRVTCPTSAIELALFDHELGGQRDLLVAPSVLVPPGVVYKAVVASAP